MMTPRRSRVKYQPNVTLVKDELGILYRGTSGHLMRKTMLLAFVEEFDHHSEALLEGAFEQADGTNTVEIALEAVNVQTKLYTTAALSYAGDESNEEDKISI